MSEVQGLGQVKSYLEAWRRSLLDLSRRNRLLYFSTGIATRIQLTKPTAQLLYQTLVGEERVLDFPHARGATLDDLDLGEPSAADIRIVPGDVKVLPPVEGPNELRDLNRRLERLRRGTQTIFEEQGVHTLFAALGLLEWREAEHAEEVVRSPLVLLPVVLERTEDRFRLRAHEEGIEVNPALAYRLQRDFGVSLPELGNEAEDEDSGPVISEFFARVREAVGHRGWRVSEEVWLAQFAFHKLPMYRDLGGEEVVERAAAHPVVATLCGVRDAPKASEVDVRQVEDAYARPEAFPVVDADSSQLEVLERVRRGETLVVQGPPGTGKSQTIVNLIAQALRDGKKVLFVSEKRAALEVVYRRLQERGLTGLCLDLHSHQANRKAVVNELKSTLDSLASWQHKPDEAEFDEYRKLKVRLDEYVRELHRPRDRKGRTAYDVHGRLARLQHAPLVTSPLPFERVLEVEPGYEAKLADLIRQIAVSGVWDEESKHPWRDATPEPGFVVIPGLIAQASDRLAQRCADMKAVAEDMELHDLIGVAARVQEAYLREFGIDGNIDEGEVEALYGLLAHIEKAWWWRRLWTEWRVQRGLARLVGRWLSRGIAVSAVRALHGLHQARRWLSAREARLRDELGIGADVSASELEAVLDGLVWIGEILSSAEGKLPKQLRAVLASQVVEDVRDRATQVLGKLRSALEDFKRALQDELVASLFTRGLCGRPFEETPIEVIREKAVKWQREAGRLHEWINYQKLLQEAHEQGSENFLRGCRAQGGSAAQLCNVFWRAYFTRWLQEAYKSAPVLASLQPQNHEELRQRFRELDKRLQREAVKAVLHKVASSLPQPLPLSEETRLRKEWAKKRRHLPLRRLFPQIPNLLLALKPCLMMSPLSVVTHLPKELFEFDLVIFDEASQLPPGDAIGALLRARQAVIFGDNKQLPPTDFFQAHVESQEEEAEALDYESILDIAGACFPAPMLRWHYRSRDERLIAFSNRRFYEGKLITFPAPAVDSMETGVSFVYISEGVYGRGGSRTNVAEARRVAELVLEHFRTQPYRSLGVIAMSIEQRDAIEEALRRLRREHPEVVFPQNDAEPFFVKNLETVQGDERDVVILSVGYGPSVPEGTPTLQFGPLARQGGERRLNVAITRARYRMITLASMKPDQLAGIKSRWEGPRILAEYLEFSQRGGVASTLGGTGEPESEFEAAVRDALVGRGYQVDCQVGVSGYRIDLGVRDPDIPSRYLVGVECDGAMYHSSRTARDRDRIRQEILEGLGWTILRVWSTDWIRDPDGATARLVEAIERVRRSKHNSLGRPEGSVNCSRGMQALTSSLDEGNVSTARPFAATGGECNLQAPSASSVRFVPYHSYRGPTHTHRLLDERLETIAQVVREVVLLEGPIHVDQLFHRVLTLYGKQRLGKRIRGTLSEALQLAVRRGWIVQRSDFLWSPHQEKVVARGPGDVRRPPEHVAPEEWVAAVLEALRQLGATVRSELVHCIAEAMGYPRPSADLRGRIEEAIAALKADGRILESEGLLYLRGRPSETL